jgi:hypothetical protein
MPRRYMNDQPTPENVRALWDAIHRLSDQLLTAQTTIAEQADTISAQQAQISSTTRKAEEALLTAGQPVDIVPTIITTPGPGGSEGGTDDGLGAQGCSVALDDGHVPPGSPLTAITAGMVVCGVAREIGAGWSGPALRAVTADLATRQANAEELIERIVWHLQQVGFTSGRQNNSATGVRISNDKITVEIAGVMRAYDCMGAYDDFTSTIQMRMGEVFPARYIASTGIAD